MRRRPPPIPPSFQSLGVVPLEEAKTRIRQMAQACQYATPDVCQLIAMHVNEAILTNSIPPKAVYEALAGTPMRMRALTGHVPDDPKRQYSEDEIFDALQRHRDWMVKAMQSFPGKKSAIDLERLTKAVNSRKFSAPPKAW